MNVLNALRATNNVQRQLVRNYAFKSDLKIKWVRPEKIPCYKPEKSGDCSKLPPVSPNEFLTDYKLSKELESADPTVQALFQLGNNRNHNTTRYYREQLVKEVQRHPLDYGSMEAKLAKMTATIRRMQDHMEVHSRDVRIKVQLKELIDKRKKFLKYLRRWDYRRFEWILERLDLIYKPPPPKFHWITRKESLKKLTDLHCEKIKQERLDEYRKQLEAQQIPFLEESIKKLESVRTEQIACEVPVTVTEEKLSELKKQLEESLALRAELAETNANSLKEEQDFYETLK